MNRSTQILCRIIGLCLPRPDMLFDHDEAIRERLYSTVEAPARVAYDRLMGEVADASVPTMGSPDCETVVNAMHEWSKDATAEAAKIWRQCFCEMPNKPMMVSELEAEIKKAMPRRQLTPTIERTNGHKHELRVTTLREATEGYVTKISNGHDHTIELGLPDLDHAIGGGVEFGELVILAARPSHGKSAIALQMVHHLTSRGYPAVVISEEMSALALGKRTLQFASDVPQEYWRSSINELGEHIVQHFDGRADCFVVESCGTAERAAEVIREHVAKHKIKVAVIDYAQLLTSPGKGRYEQVTQTSITFRQLASECKIIVLLLCQLSRVVETRTKFIPLMSDLKESGQLEQDADVILFLVWPWKLDNAKDANTFQFYIGKNRNRAIVRGLVECTFNPARQMLTTKRNAAEDMANYSSALDAFNDEDF